MWLSFPDCRVPSFAWAQVQYYSTSGGSKDGPPASSTDPPVTAEKVLAAAAAGAAQPSPEGNAFACVIAICM